MNVDGVNECMNAERERERERDTSGFYHIHKILDISSFFCFFLGFLPVQRLQLYSV